MRKKTIFFKKITLNFFQRNFLLLHTCIPYNNKT